MKDYRSLEQKIRQVVYEAEQNRNTEARRKVANVGRPTDVVDGESSKQARHGEIKTKIIDEAGPETQPKEPKDETKDKKPSKDKDTVDAKKIKGGKTEVDLNPTTDDRTGDGKKIDDKAKKATKQANREGGIQEGSTSMFKSDKTFGLPADLIATVAEAMKGKCPKCGHSTCQCDGDPKKVDEALKGGQKKLDKNHNGKLDKQDFKMLRKEEAEQVDEVSNKKLDNYRAAAFKDQPAGDDGSEKYRKRKFGRDLAFNKQTGRAKVNATNEEAEQVDEVTIRSAGYGKVEVVRGGKVVKKTKDPRDAKMAVAKMGDKKNSEDMKWQKHRLAKEETDPGFSEAELARIEEIAKGL